MRRFMRTRYMLGFILAATILASVGFGIMLSTQRFRSDSHWVAHTYDTLGRIEQIRASTIDGIVAQRNYLLTADRKHLDEYLRARPTVRGEIAELAARVQDNPAQARRVARLGDLIEQRFDLAQEGVRIFQAQGLPAAQAYVRNSQGMATIAQTKALLAEMSATERGLLATRTARSDRSATVLFALGAAGIPLSLVILFWIYVLLSREIRHRGRAEQETRQLNEALQARVGELREATGDLRELSRYAGLLQTCRNIPEALDITRRALSSLLPNGGGSVCLLRASADYAEIETSWGEHAAAPHALMMPQECWAMRRAQPHCVDDLAEGMACTHIDPPRHGVASTACLPLTAQGMNLGVLYLSSPEPGPMPHIAVATAAAEQLSLALSNLRLQESLRQQSIRDALSGLYNRRYLQESLPRELARTQRRGQSLALLMLDLDFFKAFNDRHGHDGGDALITAFGRLLLSMCREEDIACRFGGEEFTLILPEVDLETALRRAEEIRAAVEEMTVRHLQREIGKVTVSIGIAIAPLHATDGENLQRLADAALYRAKREGRNRVGVAEKE